MENDPIAKELFDILSCPQCKGKLGYAEGKKELQCKDCGSKFPIEDGVPVLSAAKS